ncbi:MAG: hypothetical protein WC530_07810 [Candidatus Omnitrophota bacterium]|jgi:hypothetical protein
MRRMLEVVLLGVMTAMFVVDVPSSDAIMGIRAARRAVTARRAAKKLTDSDEANKENPTQVVQKAGQGEGKNAYEDHSI